MKLKDKLQQITDTNYKLMTALELCLPYVPKDVWRFVEPKAIVTIKESKNSDWDRVEPVARTKAKEVLLLGND